MIRSGETAWRDGPTGMAVVSYNPGYQSIRKNLKRSTKQQFVDSDFHYYPPPDKAAVIVATKSSVDSTLAECLVVPANDVRNVTTIDLEAGVSTRSLVNAAQLTRRGVGANRACSIAVAQATTDEREEMAGIELITDRVFGAGA